MVSNRHERLIHAPLESVAALIDRLGSHDDAMWPSDRWPRIRFDGPLRVGAVGGHGPIRYFIEAYEPGRSISVRFTEPRGFIGTHGFDTEEVAPGLVRLRHVLAMRVEGLARLTWPLAFRWLHDALLEDLLDRAQGSLESTPLKTRRWSWYVRIVRRVAILFIPGKNEAHGEVKKSVRSELSEVRKYVLASRRIIK